MDVLNKDNVSPKPAQGPTHDYVLVLILDFYMRKKSVFFTVLSQALHMTVKY